MVGSTERRRFPALLRWGAGALLVAVAACGGDDILLPRDGEPAHITALPGNNLSATVGQPLGEALVAKVTDPAGRPVSGVLVTFFPPADAVIDPVDPVPTNAEGQAAVNYTLSPTAGDQVVEARADIVPETNGLTAFHIVAQPESAESLTAAGGNGQTAQVKTVLPESLVVKAVDRFGNGVAGIEVTWQATGGGEVTPETVTTAADGRAAVARALGESPGSYGAVARAETLDGPPVTFVATAVAAPKPVLVLVTPPSSSAVAGVPLEQQPEIQLQDPFGAPLPEEGVKVTVQVSDGDGSVGGKTTVASDANGRVVFTDLEFRGGTGNRTLIFAASGFTPVTSTDIVVRPGPPSANQTALSVPDGTAGTRTAITLRLKDQFGNEIPGATADLALRITGANPTDNIPVEEGTGGSYTASYVPVHSGKDEVTVQYRGQPLAGASATSIVEPGPADPSTTTARVTKSGAFFIQVDIEVVARDAQGNPLGHGGDRVEIIPNGGQTRTCKPLNQADTCVDKGDGTYADRFILIGNSVSVVIRLNGAPLAGSPFVR